MGRPKVNQEQRFWNKVNKTDTCWLWTAAKDKDGYGLFDKHRAHRYRFIYDNGYSPSIVRHACDIPACVKPEHLLPGDAFSNMADLKERGNNSAWNKTHCPRGHAYSGTNVIYKKSGGRGCRKCTNALWTIRHNQITFRSEEEKNIFIENY